MSAQRIYGSVRNGEGGVFVEKDSYGRCYIGIGGCDCDHIESISWELYNAFVREFGDE